MHGRSWWRTPSRRCQCRMLTLAGTANVRSDIVHIDQPSTLAGHYPHWPLVHIDLSLPYWPFVAYVGRSLSTLTSPRWLVTIHIDQLSTLTGHCHIDHSLPTLAGHCPHWPVVAHVGLSLSVFTSRRYWPLATFTNNRTHWSVTVRSYWLFLRIDSHKYGFLHGPVCIFHV